MKIIKIILRYAIVTLVVLGWVFSGWPQVWQSPSFPPKVQKAHAAITARSSTTAVTNNGTTLAITLPSDIEVGDLILVGIGHRAGTGGAIATPTGWTAVAAQLNSGTVLGAKNFYKVAESGDAGSSVTFNSGAGSNTKITAVAVAFGGVDPNDLIHGNSGQVNASSVNIVAPSVTAASPAVRIAFGSTAYGTTIGVTSGWTQSGHISSGGGPSNSRSTSAQQRLFSTTPNPPAVTMVADNAAVSIGVQIVLKEAPLAPIVTTQSASSVSETSATLNGTITATGGANVTVRGFAWGTSATMQGDTATTTDTAGQPFGTGAFTDSSITFVCNTTYYSRAYATNSFGDGLGSISSSFTTSACSNSSPTLSVSEPDGTSDTVVVGDSYNITYTLADTDDTVTAAFYYDSNNSGLDGTAISGACATAAEGTDATCSWDTTGITAGSYYVYGITNDGTNPDVSAYSSGQITINDPTIYSVTITSSGSIEYGFVEINTASSTVGTSYTQTAQNDGNTTEKLNVKSSNAAANEITDANWILASTVGTDQFKHEVSTTTGSTWVTMPDSSTYVTADASVDVSGTLDFDFRLTAPTNASDYGGKTITITIQAVAP